MAPWTGVLFAVVLSLLTALPSHAGTVTLGTSSVLGTTESGHGNLLVATRYTLEQPGTLESLSLYVQTASGQARVGLYADSNGAPGALLASTDAWTLTTGWNTRPIPPVTLPAGTYWLAWTLSSSTAALRSQWGTGTTRYVARTFGALPSTWPSGSGQESVILSQYGTVTTAPVALPGKPVIVGVTLTGGVELSWQWTPDPTITGTPSGYTIEGNIPPSSSWTVLGQVAQPTTTWTVSGLTLSTQYCFRVGVVGATLSKPAPTICVTVHPDATITCAPASCTAQ